MRIIFEIITFLMIVSPVFASKYDAQHTLQCDNLQDNWTIQQNFDYLWNIIVLHDIDKFCFLVFCPIAIFIQIFLIVTFCKYNLFNHSPEDIIFSLLITQIFVAACYFSNAMYSVINSYNDPMPSNFPVFCITLASINAFFGCVQKFYLIYFLIHVILNVNMSIKQGKWFKGKWKHVVPFVISVVLVVIAGLFGELGYSQLGICQLADTRSDNAQLYFPIVEVLFSVSFIILSIITYRYFKEHMPQSSALNRRKYEQNLLITRFTIGISVIQGLFSAAILGLYINCHTSDPNPQMLILATIFNLTRIIEFYYLIIVVLLYKKVGNKLKKFIRSCFAKKGDDQSELQTRRVTHRQLFELIDIGLKQKILDILEEENQIDFIKVTQIMTILTGVRTSYREYLVQEEAPKQIKNLHYHQQVCFRIDSKWMKDYEQEALILPRLSLLDGKCTIYSPQIFKRLLSFDKVTGIDESFDLIKNSDQLYKICDNNKGGGRSGQFFFFSCDNKYILKTVNKEEFKTLLDQLELFYNHFINNPDTLICRFYGMFKIEHKQISRKYYIILMKNISGCNKLQIRRIFDMKGSTDDRKVLKDSQDQTQLPQGTGVVYKDLDFLRLEKKMYIPNSYATQIRNQLKIDTIFLKELNIIDYSLLVMIVDWEEEPNDPNFWAKLQRVPSINCDLLYYHISLIDVSQKWDLQKKGEQWWKKILGKKDTSAQQPSVYQNRFINFISEITAMGSNIGKIENEDIRFEEKMEGIEMAFQSKQIPIPISLVDNATLTDPMIQGHNLKKSKSVV